MTLPVNKILCGDALDVLRTLPDACVHCVVTSPPYWGLRDYGWAGQLGLEPTFGEYLVKLTAIFEQVRRVLRPDGTLWLNMGDSYATGTTSDRKPTVRGKHGYWENPAVNKRVGAGCLGLKPKNLVGQPWRVAFALQAAGCPADGVCLDPFMGSGTTALVASKLGRNWLGIELNPKYIELAKERLGLFALTEGKK